MTSHQTSRFIGAAFGLVFVLANAGALPAAARTPLRMLAIGAFLLLFRAIRRAAPAPGDPAPATAPAAGAVFGRGYRLIVAAEVAALLGGLVVLNPVLHAPRATVGWIALVVGLHFFGLGLVWRRPSIHALAGALTACGAAGLVLAGCGAPDAAIRAVAGVLPGLVLLGSVGWSVRGRRERLGAPA
ncbi:hypothetical protein [Streptomyces sp. NPDC089919]|uniref:hypothetical protein n=1 Tax=Streptomyces sp. NPDC089919 TaxID=3155188 RepID=UPI00344AC6C5